MLRPVKVWNRSYKPVPLGKRTVPAGGTLTMPHSEYVRAAAENDLVGLPISVDMPKENLRRASVRDFGAKGNGIDDDTAAMQAAIDYVSGYGGGVVDVPIGVYPFTSLYIAGEVSLQGESKLSSVLKQLDTAKGAALSFASAYSRVSQLRVICNGGA